MDTHERNEREVTDPITHLPLTIHDDTSAELSRLPPSTPPPKTSQENQSNGRHSFVDLMCDDTRREWVETFEEKQSKRRVEYAILTAVVAAMGGMANLVLSSLFLGNGSRPNLFVGSLLSCLVASLAAVVVFFFLGLSQNPSVDQTNENRNSNPTDASPSLEKPESAAWLNSFTSVLWPIVNPALFTAVSNIMEDSMQSTLPSLVQGVRVVDVGQGAEPVRIIGIRKLEAGDATVQKDEMEAEEGDFVNLEVAVSYRAKSTKSGNKDFRGRSQNAHLLMQFWTVGGFMLPVWVELTALLATVRLRIRLTPNPPFLSALTVTLLGQPKVSISCTPLAKSFLNVMDIPGLRGWLQKNVDEVMAKYVAPRSLTLDLKKILGGKEKLDTDAEGLVFVRVRRAMGFRNGDAGNMFKTARAKYGDPYVTLAWGKWGKSIWSTRIIPNENKPVWDEFTALLVSPSELNAQEKLRLQLWDSDRGLADDHLGTVEISLDMLMTGSETLNRWSFREDPMTNLNGSPTQGTLIWDVAYFSKTTVEQQCYSPEEQAEKTRAMENTSEKEAIEKMRAAEFRASFNPRKEDPNEVAEHLIASSKPSEEWPTGILSVRLDQIHGLETGKIAEDGSNEREDEDAVNDLPSAYCTVIFNHRRVHKTRVKLKSNNPHFDTGFEEFITDWRNTTVIVAVHNAHLHKKDEILGIVVLPLRSHFKERSQVTDTYPITGGSGFGRIRLALTFRSVQAKLPRYALGWDVGTLRIHPRPTGSVHLPADLAGCRLAFHTIHGKEKFIPQCEGGWKPKYTPDDEIHLAVTKRYSSCLLVTFRKRHCSMAMGNDRTPAFCVLWLQNIPDDEDMELSLPVRKSRNDGVDLIEQARSNASDIGEQVGTLNVTLRYVSGLSKYHRESVTGDSSVGDVLEVLECIQEESQVP